MTKKIIKFSTQTQPKSSTPEELDAGGLNQLI